jgi:hypothetical protein
LEDLTDSRGTNTLTNNNTATFETGKIDNAVSLLSASSQYLSVASNSTLQAGNIDFWIACWVNFTTLSGTREIVTKFNVNSNADYELYYFNTRIRFAVYASNAGTRTAHADIFGTPTTGVWYFVMVYNDSVNDVVKISINGGAFDSTSTAGFTPFASTGPVAIGTYDAGGGNFLNGKVDEVSFGKNPSGGIASLANEIRDTLYCRGMGQFYPWLSTSCSSSSSSSSSG